MVTDKLINPNFGQATMGVFNAQQIPYIVEQCFKNQKYVQKI